MSRHKKKIYFRKTAKREKRLNKKRRRDKKKFLILKANFSEKRNLFYGKRIYIVSFPSEMISITDNGKQQLVDNLVSDFAFRILLRSYQFLPFSLVYP